jgi:hypothetical protein
MIKHVNAAKMKASQKAQQSKARLEKQVDGGSKHFTNGSNEHRGAAQSQSGKPGRRR